MKKLFTNNPLLLSFLALSLFIPSLASAQARPSATTTAEITIGAGEATEAQMFTACSQSSIEIRDSAISSARTAYNNAMTLALDARKEAEKRAVAITDASEKKTAIKIAVDEYKKAVNQTQEGLTKARKEAWGSFEENMKACRDDKENKRNVAPTANQATVVESQPQLRTLNAEMKLDQAVQMPADEKSLKDFIISSFRGLFKKAE